MFWKVLILRIKIQDGTAWHTFFAIIPRKLWNYKKGYYEWVFLEKLDRCWIANSWSYSHLANKEK